MDRPPAVAGYFYPADENELSRAVELHLGQERAAERAISVIAPHAGYKYSGDIAGQVFAGVHVPDVSVVLGPNHTGRGARSAIVSSGNFLLPGLRIPVAGPVAEELRALALLTEDALAHRDEHALEVQLPFLCARNRKTRIAPVCLGHISYDACVRIGSALADVVARHGRDVLIVASTDMSHYLPAERAESLDRMCIERIEALDPAGLYRTVVDHQISMCGFIPTTIALHASVALGAKEARLIRYGSSGEVSGDFDRVVGYAGFIVR